MYWRNGSRSYDGSAALRTLSERRTITGQVLVLTITNTFYIVRRLADLKTARRALMLLRDMFTPVACNCDIINQAIVSRISDFENAAVVLY